uniref:High molecular weight storage protein 15.6K chain n=1 Tax=Brassica campestris TaxID=3711 RepID=Q7M1J8_BRACM
AFGEIADYHEVELGSCDRYMEVPECLHKPTYGVLVFLAVKLMASTIDFIMRADLESAEVILEGDRGILADGLDAEVKFAGEMFGETELGAVDRSILEFMFRADLEIRPGEFALVIVPLTDFGVLM